MPKIKPARKRRKVVISSDSRRLDSNEPPSYFLWHGKAERLLDHLPEKPLFDLIVTSPPYNIGKPYERKTELTEYSKNQQRTIHKLVKRLKPTGSLCWQVGNYVSNGTQSKGSVFPLDILFHPLFQKAGLTLRNRIVWRFGHGLHCKNRFSGRYEVVLWYTKTEEYKFDLDSVRIPSKYPGKRHYKGKKKGQLSSNPDGKNPEDVWDIPNVKSNHVEKTGHPCQFPVGLIERLILALTAPGDLIFDPYAGVGSAGVAAAVRGRKFWGCDTKKTYLQTGKKRISAALWGKAAYRPHDKPIFDHRKSPLSKRPRK